MDFFEHQEDAQRKTRWLLGYFALAVIGIILAVYAVVVVAVTPSQQLLDGRFSFWNPALLVWVALGALVFILGGSLYKISELAQGGRVVALALGGQSLNPQTTDPDERRLLNVVEEMAIASGIPVPDVFVLRNEPGINAFAAGYSPSDAVIGVTWGCLKSLTRDELQGVIAHEFSHLLNGDMKLNMRLIGLVFGILSLSIIGRLLLRVAGDSGSRKNGPLLLLGLALFLIGWIGMFFGQLIKSAIARQREFLADAAAIQFTRQPDGLRKALLKIGGLAQQSRLETPQAQEASHLFFGNAMGDSWIHWMATHPPLKERVRRLDPSFNGTFPPFQLPALSATAALAGGAPAASATIPLPLGLKQAAKPLASPHFAQALEAAAVVAALGNPGAKQLSYSSSLLAALPPILVQAAREPYDACALSYALLLSSDEAIRAAQLQMIETQTTFQPRILQIYPLLQNLEARSKLPLIELSLPALRRLATAQYQQFSQMLQQLIEADQQIDLFEYTLQKILRRHLEPYYHPIRPPVVQYYKLTALLPEISVLLSALAHLGHADDAQKKAAYLLGAQKLDLSSKDAAGFSLRKFEECNLPQIDAALDRLAQASAPLKRRMLNAAVHTVAADGVIQDKEAELLRAMADALGCRVNPVN